MKKAHALYLKACKALGKTPIPVLEDRSDLDKVSSDANDRLVICIRFLNMINGKVWKQKYDGSEWHYYPRWYKNRSGSGFLFTVYDTWHSNTYVGPRLEYRSYDIMKKGVDVLKPFYDDYLNF